ncbi:hypothetical protein MA03_03085 [Infirmifilum uzonense]|uniref:Uncharacterized protein n=1 Tax=Infirmifilum uzonense TaxID=1550241 RepID=A0A0F7FHV1_9CREN|nr:hypothetical protein MA03_03085 [Infirmifilum uzonense]
MAKNGLNPLLKRSAGRAVLALLFALFVFLIAVPPFIIRGVAPYPSLLTNAGLTRNSIKDATGATLTVTIILTLIRGRREIAASEEAEHELLLALPVTMAEYLVGKTLYFSFQTLFYTIPLVFFATPLLYTYVEPSPTRPLIFMLSLPLIALYSETLVMLATLARIALSRTRLPEVTGYAYLALSGIHSLMLSRLSPLLTLPGAPIAGPMIDVFSRRVDTYTLVVEFLLLLASSIAMVALLAVLSRVTHPENIRPLYEMLREMGLWKRKTVRLSDASIDGAVRKVILGLSITSSRHLFLVGTGLAFSSLLAVVLRELNISVDALTLSSFGAVFLASEATISTAFTVQRDLSNLWLYRLYPASLKPLTRSLMTKTAVYYVEGLLFLALFRAVYDSRPAWLLLPITALPLMILATLLILSTLVRIASRRRLVRYSSRGFYMVEDLTATAIMGLSGLTAIIVLALHELFVEYSTGFLNAFMLATGSALISVLLWKISEDILYEQIWYSDVQ